MTTLNQAAYLDKILNDCEELITVLFIRQIAELIKENPNLIRGDGDFDRLLKSRWWVFTKMN